VPAGAATLGFEVDIDGKELGLAIYGLPHCCKRLPALLPGWVCRIDTTRVELELRAWQYSIGICAGTRVVLMKTQHLGVVKICLANVGVVFASILIIDWVDGGERVAWSSEFPNLRNQIC